MNDHAAAVRRLIYARREEMIALRRELHAEPELSFEEHRTAGRIAEILEGAGLEVRTGIGNTGVSAVVRGAQPGMCLMIRADMDALPLQEEGSAAYASRREGVMHACGHDGHVAVAVTVAQALADLRDQLRGEVQFVFQPAEEAIGGAKAMLDDGVLGQRRPAVCLALHIWNLLPAGCVGVREGALFAATDQFSIRVLGRGGHGAMPHQTVDPVPVAAQIITALQTIVSRETSPFESVVVTIGTIHGGTAYNIIPSSVEMRGTARSFRRETQLRLKERIEEIVRGVTSGARADYEYEYAMPCPSVVNDAEITAFVRQVAVDVLGADRVLLPEPTMGGDDMSYFLQEVPGCYFFVGGAPPGVEPPRHHSPTFDFDERALTVGAEVLATAAVRFLGERPEAGS